MSDSDSPNWQVEVFYDGACPLCLREIRMLRYFDRQARIRFTDISASDFLPTDYGLTMTEFMSEIRGRLPGGQWIKGVEVFRRLYGAIGLSLLVAVSRVPGISHLLDWLYRLFAKNRLRLTGRCNTSDCGIERAVTRRC